MGLDFPNKIKFPSEFGFPREACFFQKKRVSFLLGQFSFIFLHILLFYFMLCMLIYE